jgi:hypothetical protein
MQQSVTVNQFILEHARVLRRSKTSQAENTGNDVQVQQQAAIIYPQNTAIKIFPNIYTNRLRSSSLSIAANRFANIYNNKHGQLEKTLQAP